MSRRERQRAFAAAALVVAAAVAALSALGSSRHGERPPSPTAHPPSVTAPSPDPRESPAQRATAREVEDVDSRYVPEDPGAGSARREAARRARRFIAAFISYQAERLDESTERRLRVLATPQLASYLLEQPPRGRRTAHPRVSVERLELAGPYRGRIKAAALLAYRGGRRSLLELALERTGTRWRVTDLYPSED
jgi:hypothetical protein